MKTPDKIYVVGMKTSEDQDAFVGFAYELNKLALNPTEYISKEALLEWLREKHMDLDPPGSERGFGRLEAIEAIIDKINSL